MSAVLKVRRLTPTLPISLARLITKVWSELEAVKGVIVEETEAASEFKATKKRYEAAIDDPEGGSAVLLAVYRGKMSEVMLVFYFIRDSCRSLSLCVVVVPVFARNLVVVLFTVRQA